MSSSTHIKIIAPANTYGKIMVAYITNQALELLETLSNNALAGPIYKEEISIFLEIPVSD